MGTATIDVLDRGQLLVALATNTTTLANNISIIGRGWLEGAGELGSIRFVRGTLSGAVTLKGDSRITHYGAGDSGTITGVISQTGGIWDLEKTGAGTLTLTNQNTYTGETLIQDGTLVLASAAGPAILGNVRLGTGSATQPNLRMGADNQFGSGVVLTFGNAAGYWGRFDLRGTDQTLAGIVAGNASTQGGGVIQNRGLNDIDPGDHATLTLNGSGAYVYHGYIRDNDTASNYRLSLAMTGTGTQTLAGGELTYTGTTTVENGTLVMSGRRDRANVASASYTINNGGTLSFTVGDMFGNHNTAVNPTVNINAGGTLTTTQFSRLGTLNLAGGTLTSTAGGWQGFAWGLAGDVTVTAPATGSATSTISGVGDVALGMAQVTGTRFNVASTATLSVSADIVNSAAVNTSARQASFYAQRWRWIAGAFRQQ